MGAGAVSQREKDLEKALGLIASAGVVPYSVLLRDELARSIADALAEQRREATRLAYEDAANRLLDPGRRQTYVLMGPRMLVQLGHEFKALAERAAREGMGS